MRLFSTLLLLLVMGCSHAKPKQPYHLVITAEQLHEAQSKCKRFWYVDNKGKVQCIWTIDPP